MFCSGMREIAQGGGTASDCSTFLSVKFLPSVEAGSAYEIGDFEAQGQACVALRTDADDNSGNGFASIPKADAIGLTLSLWNT
jgi:hypothetical protein